jgi:hypothetical protein
MTKLPVLEQVAPLKAFRFSPSTVDTFERCPTKWAFHALGGLKEPQRPSAAFGELVHLHRETYYKTGTFPNGSTEDYDVARMGLRELPEPAPGTSKILVEHFVRLNTPNGPGNGKIDIFVPDQGAVGYRPLDVNTDGVPLVLDHKTTADIGKYAKTPEKLRADSQTIFYGASAVALVPGARAIDFCWSYLQKGKRRRHKAMHLRMSVDEVLEGFWRMVHGPVQKMLSLYNARSTLRLADVPRNVHACNDFGGCAYRAICPATETERVAVFLATSVSLEEKVKEMNAPNNYGPNGNNVTFPVPPGEGNQIPFPPMQQNFVPPQYVPPQYVPPPAQQPPQDYPQQPPMQQNPQYAQQPPMQQNPQYAQQPPMQQPPMQQNPQYAQQPPMQQPPMQQPPMQQPPMQQFAPPPPPPPTQQAVSPTQVLPPDAPDLAPTTPPAESEKPKRGRGRPPKEAAPFATGPAVATTGSDALPHQLAAAMADVVLTLGLARDPESVAELAYQYTKAIRERFSRGG